MTATVTALHRVLIVRGTPSIVRSSLNGFRYNRVLIPLHADDTVDFDPSSEPDDRTIFRYSSGGLFLTAPVNMSRNMRLAANLFIGKQK